MIRSTVLIVALLVGLLGCGGPDEEFLEACSSFFVIAGGWQEEYSAAEVAYFIEVAGFDDAEHFNNFVKECAKAMRDAGITQ